MSAQKIIAELPNLKPEEWQIVKDKVEALQAAAPPKTGWGRALASFTGVADDLPEDPSANHNSYLYGTKKER